MLNNLIDWVIENGGLYVMLFIIFAETGLLLGFFLPGDSLLFAAGIYANKLSASFYNVHYSVIILLIIIASVLGNMAGYWFGNKTGPLLYERKETFLFRRKHLMRAHDFYEKYGKATVFLAKFLPIIRTFAPIVAGIVKMPKATFTFYNILGSIVWVTSMVLGGHFLESWVLNKYGFSLKEHIDIIAIIIILVTTLPVLFKLFLGKKPVVDTNIKVDTNVK
ncbi:DedA family protein [Ilyomonas limi]|jgi:membrane-associated protein|uniref:DedA family protein n=1 Tax=Ilyomonas limi TaxID=2575867 RepID=A0A4U3L2Y4_9BACT|nr:VTT domain-containing protein [Ilyomonas limi]TKK69242.1 DedA family protein [Ilyomonas limi]